MLSLLSPLLLLPVPQCRYVCLKERNMLLTQIAWEEANERQLQQRSPMRATYIRRITQVSDRAGLLVVSDLG
jgi:hypothetical protein